MRTVCLATLLGIDVALCASYAAAEDPWADAYFDYNPVEPVNAGFDTPQKVLGPPVGGGLHMPGNTSLVCLGVQGGSIVLKFDTPVTDDPRNPMGLDCIVYSNAFFLSHDPGTKWQEPALIEISQDVNGNGLPDDPWYLIPGSKDCRYDPAPDHTEPPGDMNDDDPANILAGNVENPNRLLDADPENDDEEYFWGYAELTPTLKKYLDNYVRPDDPYTVGVISRSGGGDAFDIEWAVDQAGNPAGLEQFDFIRLRAFIYRQFDSFGYATPEVDAVADVAAEVDTDGDGIFDEYETRVIGTDPTRPENTLLALEIPLDEGGSPHGTFLGMACDACGNRIELYAADTRTETGRPVDTMVDISVPERPDGTLPPGGWVKSWAVREFQSEVPDFVATGIQPARITIAYASDEIEGLDERRLRPFHFDGANYTGDGIGDVHADPFNNQVSFTSTRAGIFLLASKPGEGDNPLPLHGAPGLLVLMGALLVWRPGRQKRGGR